MLVYDITTRTSFDVIVNIRRLISQRIKEVGKSSNSEHNRESAQISYGHNTTCVFTLIHGVKHSLIYIENLTALQELVYYCI